MASKSGVSAALEGALEEIRRSSASLDEAGDRAFLGRYTDPEKGFGIASLLGFSSLLTEEARVVTQLSYLPGAMSLIREYLSLLEAPRSWDLEPGAETVAKAPEPELAPTPPLVKKAA